MPRPFVYRRRHVVYRLLVGTFLFLLSACATTYRQLPTEKISLGSNSAVSSSASTIVKSGLPKEIPVFPGSIIIQTYSGSLKEPVEPSVDYFTQESKEVVKTFYDRELARQGWTPIKTYSGFHGWADSPSGWAKIFEKLYIGEELYITVGNESEYEYFQHPSSHSESGTYYRLYYSHGKAG